MRLRHAPSAILALALLASLPASAQTWTPGPTPPPGLVPRAYHAVAYDPLRGCIVVFGGYDGAGYLGDTWELDGLTSWVPGGSAPPALTPRSAASMAFDGIRARVLLFGGQEGGGGLFDETWEYDGMWWPGATAPAGLTPRSGASMAFDDARGVNVLFGGFQANGYVAETWELGATWNPGAAPPAALEPRALAAIGFDASTDEIVLFGGTGLTGNYNDTWRYDGATWNQGPAAPTGLGPRAAMAYSFEQIFGQEPHLTIFGGFQGVDETWQYGATTSWLQLPPAPPGLTPRAGAGMAFDLGRQAMVLFGGDRNGTTNAETWVMSAPGCNGTIDVCFQSSSAGCLNFQTATMGAPATFPLKFTGGTPLYTVTLVGGSLPPGMQVDNTDVSGTPTLPGNYTFTLRVVDALGCTVQRSFDIAVFATANRIAGMGSGATNPALVRIYQKFAASVDLYAYSANHGARVAAGELGAAGSVPFTDELVTGPGPSPALGPHVRAFLADGSPVSKVSFYAYATPRYGVNPAGGDLDADGFHEIVTGPGAGAVFGPHLRAWNVDGGLLTPISKINAFVYGTLKWGLNVTTGDLDDGLRAEMVTAPGPGIIFAPTVRAFAYDGVSLASIQKVNFDAFAVPQYGANVAAGDLDLDVLHDILGSPGPGGSSQFSGRFRGFQYDGVLLDQLAGADVDAFPGSLYGGRPGSGYPADLDGRDLLLASPGPDPSVGAFIDAYYHDVDAFYLQGRLDAFPGATYGASPGAGSFGY